jgi:hypothetical protein
VEVAVSIKADLYFSMHVSVPDIVEKYFEEARLGVSERTLNVLQIDGVNFFVSHHLFLCPSAGSNLACFMTPLLSAILERLDLVLSILTVSTLESNTDGDQISFPGINI